MGGAGEATVGKTSAGWLHSSGFDSFFIFGNATIALIIGTIALKLPVLFPIILAVNIWGLGYHHVIATFSRLCFDKQSHRHSLLLIYALAPAVFGAVVALAHFEGMWVIATIYLYGQWFHYSRQSWGISRAYERNAPKGYTADRSWQTQAAFYSFPLWGILYRSWQHPKTFLNMPLKVLPVSFTVVEVVGAISLILFALWLVRVYKDWKQGVLPVAYTCFMLTHFGIFFFSYVVMPTIDSGWLVTNIWHNLQYVMFVWMFNNRTYRNGLDPKAYFLSFISQKKNVVLYFTLMLSISTLFYILIALYFQSFNVGTALVVYMAINFHHYIVDAIIWRASWIKRGKMLAETVAA